MYLFEPYTPHFILTMGMVAIDNSYPQPSNPEPPFTRSGLGIASVLLGSKASPLSECHAAFHSPFTQSIRAFSLKASSASLTTTRNQPTPPSFKTSRSTFPK
jgi:hypothetical protein